jgi:IS5 family transposase
MDQKKGWRVHIQRKVEKGQPLSACQERRNTRIARVRARVEHVFAAMEQMGGKRLRCVGLDRAIFQLTGKAATYNLRRLCSLKACGVAAF